MELSTTKAVWVGANCHCLLTLFRSLGTSTLSEWEDEGDSPGGAPRSASQPPATCAQAFGLKIKELGVKSKKFGAD